jgi:hypothetical protein
MNRTEYRIRLTINGRRIAKVIIDPHYKLKHSGSISDKVILELVQLLSGGSFDPEAEVAGFQYFVSDNLILGQKQFRLIWLLEKDELYIGVVNACRRRK